MDLVEERKILCFLEAISDFKTVGVELSGTDTMEVEKWPLIQVYANSHAFQELRRQSFHYYVSSYSYMCPHTYRSRYMASKSWEGKSSRCAKCVLILLYMGIYVSLYFYLCALIRYMALKSWEGKVSSRCATKCSTEAQVLSLLALPVQKCQY